LNVDGITSFESTIILIPTGASFLLFFVNVFLALSVMFLASNNFF